MNILEHLDTQSMPQMLKQAWDKFNLPKNDKNKISLNDLILICCKWTVENFALYAPKELPEKPIIVDEYDNLTEREIKKLSDELRRKMEYEKRKWSQQKCKIELGNDSNYKWLLFVDKTLNGVKELKPLIEMYEEKIS